MKRNAIGVKLMLGAILLIGGIAGFYCFWGKSTDEAQMRRTIRHLCNVTSKPSGEKALTGVWKSREVENIFAPECEIVVNFDFYAGKYSLQRLSSTLLRYRTHFRNVHTDATDVEVKKTAKDRANVSFSGHLSGYLKQGSEHLDEVRDVICHFVKIDGRWLIDKMEIHEILEK